MATNPSIPITGIDHLHLIVGNALQSAYYYRAAFGFSLTAYRGPETGTQDHASYVLEQGRIRLVLSTPLAPEHPMYDHIRTHGDGIRDVAFAVDDPAAAWKTAIERGARSAYEPSALQNGEGILRMAGIRAFGDTIHSFIGRGDYRGPFRPGFHSWEERDAVARPAGLLQVVGLTAVAGGAELKQWASFYEQVLGFARSPDSTDTTVQLSTQTPGGGILRLNLKESEVFLAAYQGAGVECVTFAGEGPGRAAAPVQDRATLRFEIIG